MLSTLSDDDALAVERLIRTLILATDITRQQEFLTRMREIVDADDERKVDDVVRHARRPWQSDEFRAFILQVALKCADVNNPARPWPVCRLWGEQCVKEFFRQGDRERVLKLQVGGLVVQWLSCPADNNVIYCNDCVTITVTKIDTRVVTLTPRQKTLN